MKPLLITIAIPAYNNEKSIQKTIDSCLEQETDIAYEILILDDASTDSTPKIIKSYTNEKIRIVTLEERVPLIANHNKCLEHAKGEYILFCHADDKLESHAITYYAKKLKQRNFPSKYVVWGHSMFRDYSQKISHFDGFSYNTMQVGEYTPKLFFYGGLTPSGTLYSRQSFLDLDGYIYTEMNASPSDMTTMIYLAMHGFRFEMVDEMLFYREGSSTALVYENDDIYLSEIEDAFKFLIKKIDTPVLKKLLKLSIPLKNKPFYFLYAMSQEKELHSAIKKIMLKEILCKPWILRQDVIKRTLSRVF